jgi:hypothetical protein
MSGKKLAGSVKASASKTIGSPVVAMELGPRGWDPGKASQKAMQEVKRHFPKAKITEMGLVCYCYPKIGVQFDVEDPQQGFRSVIFDVSDLSMVTRFGSDELEGFSSYSFYQEVAEPQALERERRWELADKELEAARSATPRIFERAFSAPELEGILPMLTPPTIGPVFPFYSEKTLKYSPRCTTHDCFALYAQQTSVYCAVATGQMILDFHRYNYTQDQIAAAMGTGAGGTSNPGQVDGYKQLSNFCLDATLDTTADWSEAKAEIDANRPLKSGIPGHARDCTGWKRQNIFIIGQAPKRWLRIHDLWPWNADICAGGAIVWEDWDAINHTNFIYVRHRTTPCQ